LSGYLRTRFQTGKSEADIPVAGVPLPCLFNPPNSNSSTTVLERNEKLSSLRKAWDLLFSSKAADGVSQMKTILQSETFPRELVPQVSYYVACGIKAGLRQGDLKSAQELWQIGVRINPDPEGKQLAYLGRLMERPNLFSNLGQLR
jgi:hypothetical protein